MLSSSNHFFVLSIDIAYEYTIPYIMFYVVLQLCWMFTAPDQNNKSPKINYPTNK